MDDLIVSIGSEYILWSICIVGLHLKGLEWVLGVSTEFGILTSLNFNGTTWSKWAPNSVLIEP